MNTRERFLTSEALTSDFEHMLPPVEVSQARMNAALSRVALITAYMDAKAPTRLTHTQEAIEAWDLKHPQFAGMRAELWGSL